MEKEKILNYLVNLIQEKMGCEYEVSPIIADKINEKRYGIMFRKGNENISPTLYIDTVIAHLCKETNQANLHEETNQAADKIISDYQNIPVLNIQIQSDKLIEIVNNYDAARPRLRCMLINTSANTELLKKLPHRSVLDLSIIYYIYLNHTEEGTTSINVTKDMLKKWNVTENDLHKVALDNMQQLFPIEFLSMENIFGVQLCESEIYALSNKNLNKGAVVILYDDCLKQVSDKLEDDLYLIPSSVNEWVVLRKQFVNQIVCQDADEDMFGLWNEEAKTVITSMIAETNATEVPIDEVLSDHPYFYDRKTGLLYDTNGMAYQLN